ncbi:MAG: alpha/beta hydrolase fold domain-containing protein, partial [Acidimicrobiales bacterium]
VVVSVDYDTAPGARFPVAEEEAFDVAEWARGAGRGWDGGRLAVGGLSAGAKLAVNVCQQARDAGTPMPLGLISGYGAADLTLGPSQRTSPKKHPAVAPWLIKLMYRAYFAGADRGAPHATPGLDDDLAAFPPSLVLTGDLDVMAAESERFADLLAAAGVPVTRERFPGVDHGFTHDKPFDVAVRALDLMADHLAEAFTAGVRP